MANNTNTDQMPNDKINELIKALGFDGPEQTNSSDDFAECAVWDVRSAIERAYEMGRASK